MNKNKKSKIITKLDEKKRKEITEIFTGSPWNLYCSMNLPPGCDCPEAIKLIKTWQKRLSAKEKIDIGCAGVYDPLPHPHLHIMALGHSEHNVPLTEDDMPKAHKCWASITKQSTSMSYICCESRMIGLGIHILLHNTPSALSVPIVADFNALIVGAAAEESRDGLRELFTNLWSDADLQIVTPDAVT